MTQPDSATNTSRQDVRDQADEHDDFVRSGQVTAHKTGEVFSIPSMLLLDDDQQVAYEALQHKVNQCDRHDDTEVPERQITVKDSDGDTTTTTIKAHIIKGGFIEPYQKDGDLLAPPYNVQLTKIVLGDDYDRFKEAGGRSNEVVLEILRMNRESDKRRATDSKSGDGAGTSEGVPAGD